jgi:hypothetical protein
VGDDLSRDCNRDHDFYNYCVHGWRVMSCVWCGSKGGFANRLIFLPVDMDSALYECEWCSLKIDVDLMKQGVDFND